MPKGKGASRASRAPENPISFQTPATEANSNSTFVCVKFAVNKNCHAVPLETPVAPALFPACSLGEFGIDVTRQSYLAWF